MTYKTEAIILRSFDIKEYDRMYTIFSREHGKLSVLGIGTRKPTAKLASGLEPLTKSEIFLVRGRRFDRVKGVIIDNQYPELKKQLEFLDVAKKTTRIIDQLAPEREQSDEIYETLETFLDYLDKTDLNGTVKLLQAGLLWKVIQWSGQEPKLFQCAQCNSRLADQDSYSFSFPEGVLCGKCGGGYSDARMKVGKDAIKLLRIFLFKDFSLLAKIKTSRSTLAQVLGVTKTMAENLLGRRAEL